MSPVAARWRLGFHGAARTVTGSRYLLEGGGGRTLIDVGLFQGFKKLRELNWREPPFSPHSVDRVLLTHAHIDHIGALPRLVRHGFAGPVHCTRATRELARILLLDSAKLHEEDARYANKKGFSKHEPALPLYTTEDAEAALKLFEVVGRDEWVELDGGARAGFHGAGHILGSTHIEVQLDGGASLVFSGDIGRYGMPLHLDPQPRPSCAVLVCESTYGDRDHDVEVPIEEQLRRPIAACLGRGGTVLIPAFAVGRSQQITLILRRLIAGGDLPHVPLHIDSPMAVDATRVYSQHLDEHHLDADVFEDGRNVLFPENVELCRSTGDSKRLNGLDGPRIIISASGMLSGGRVLHHLKRRVGERENLILIAGFQAPGTRGRALLEGQPTVRIHGQEVPVRAEIDSIHGLSAHADRGELLRWIESAPDLPKKVFLTHGEPEAAFAFARRLESKLGLDVEVPEMDQTVELDAWM
ncbi:MAG TPA: MBL fold metallo-hydrolase [Thermoanaerobaculia bacterium]|nr:MBL fold metallo-hydrolase [Thermoanaerobaculia bacterium]